MNHQISVKRIACCLLVLASLPSWAVDATGFVRVESCSLMEGMHLHLERFRGHKLLTPIVFKIPKVLDYMPRDFIDVPAAECAGPLQCEAAAKSKIQVLHVSHCWLKSGEVSGNFAVEFRDGRKFEGSFKAKERKREAQIICE